MRKQEPIKWEQIEPRIRPMVEFLNNKGFTTLSSCGHEMYVTVDADGPDIIGWLQAHLFPNGFTDFEITYHVKVYPSMKTEQYAKVKFLGEYSGNAQPFNLALLKVEPNSHPLYLVVRNRIYTERSPEQEYGHLSYFFEEHTCPTNWTRDIVGVISQGDEDPHGFASLADVQPPPEGVTWDIVNIDSWQTVFPEVKFKPSETPWTDSLRKTLDKEKEDMKP